MTKKKINIVLLLFVLGLWGTVIYRYVSQYLYKQEVVFVDQNRNFSIDNKINKKDTFDMNNINRDPFLNRSFSYAEKKVISHVRKLGKPAKRESLIKNEYFPTVEYYGYIKSNGEERKELVLIKNNGVLMKLKLGEERGGLKILKIFKDSIQFSFNKKTRYIKKN